MYDMIIYLLLVSVSLCLVRAIKGPTAPDRIIAFDASITLVVALIAMLSFLYKSYFLVDIAIVYAVLGFIGTLAIAKYLQGEKLGG